jgi:maltokinase
VTRIEEALAQWMPNQRWFAGKGREAQLRVIGGFDLQDAGGAAEVRVHLVLDESAAPTLYQVPLTVHHEWVDRLQHAFVGEVDGDYFYDGPHDEAFTRALLRLIVDEDEGEPDPGLAAATAQGHVLGSVGAIEIGASRVLSGEQSNTSIVYEITGSDERPAPPMICKLFRVLHHGENPEVTLLGALAGSSVVPRPVGWLSGQWGDAREPSGLASGHLAFVQEFLPGAEDAWSLALRSAEQQTDFTVQARALGETTAELHRVLATALTTEESTPADSANIIEHMRARFELAAGEVASLGQYRKAIDTIFARAAAGPWPRRQRIHGDYHLGQVLAAPGRSWVVLDFEGEPLRPMSERSTLDLALRDVAGMLRSFDYVAGAYALAHPGRSAADWASASRDAFLEGYAERSGVDLAANSALLDAFEVDKASYEALYEVRNRPDWLAIPLTGIARLVEHTSETTS